MSKLYYYFNEIYVNFTKGYYHKFFKYNQNLMDSNDFFFFFVLNVVFNIKP